MAENVRPACERADQLNPQARLAKVDFLFAWFEFPLTLLPVNAAT
jgi:hypothetical protein